MHFYVVPTDGNSGDELEIQFLAMGLGVFTWNALVLLYLLPSSVKSMIVFTSPSPAWVAALTSMVHGT